MRFNEEDERNQVVEGGPWFYGKTMFALAYYDGRTAAAEVPIRSIPVWVEVFGLPPILTTKETLYMVCATLGKSVHHDNPNLLSGSSTTSTRW